MNVNNRMPDYAGSGAPSRSTALQDLLEPLLTIYQRADVFKYAKSLIFQGTGEADQMATTYTTFLAAVPLCRLCQRPEQLNSAQQDTFQTFVQDAELRGSLAAFAADVAQTQDIRHWMQCLVRHKAAITAMKRYADTLAASR